MMIMTDQDDQSNDENFARFNDFLVGNNDYEMMMMIMMMMTEKGEAMKQKRKRGPVKRHNYSVSLEIRQCREENKRVEILEEDTTFRKERKIKRKMDIVFRKETILWLIHT